MKTYTMRYPGDPSCKVEQMTREEFLKRHPREPIVIYNPVTGEVYETIPMREDEICCNFCNEDPGQVIYLVRDSRAYCETCFQSNVAHYCKEN